MRKNLEGTPVVPVYIGQKGGENEKEYRPLDCKHLVFPNVKHLRSKACSDMIDSLSYALLFFNTLIRFVSFLYFASLHPFFLLYV